LADSNTSNNQYDSHKLGRLERLNAEHRIRFSFMRHRGDISLVAEETGYPIDYIEKAAKKLKNQLKRDSSLWLASCMVSELFQGRQQRISYLEEALKEIRKGIDIDVSSCCSAFIVPNSSHNPSLPASRPFQCTQCHNSCYSIKSTKQSTIRLVFDAVDKLREEDTFMLTCMEKMGLDKKLQPDLPPFMYVDQRHIPANRKPVSAEEQEVLNRIDELPIQDAYKLRNSLMKQLTENKPDGPT
jgi:hypothetical protein